MAAKNRILKEKGKEGILVGGGISNPNLFPDCSSKATSDRKSSTDTQWPELDFELFGLVMLQHTYSVVDIHIQECKFFSKWMRVLRTAF